MKNNKKINKLISNFMTSLLVFIACINVNVYAGSTNPGSDTVHNTLVEVTQVLLVIAGLVCVGKLIHIGILFMTSAAEEKSNAKMALVPWLAGTIVAFGAAIIGPAIINIIAGNYLSRNPLDY